MNNLSLGLQIDVRPGRIVNLVMALRAFTANLEAGHYRNRCPACGTYPPRPDMHLNDLQGLCDSCRAKLNYKVDGISSYGSTTVKWRMSESADIPEPAPDGTFEPFDERP